MKEEKQNEIYGKSWLTNDAHSICTDYYNVSASAL